MAVKNLPNQNGDVTGDAVYKELDEWKLINNVCGRCFDTTSTNTGHLSAAIITLQIRLNKPILWFACRHHVNEVILTHVWDALQIEVAKSPEVSLFERFRDLWPFLDHSIKDCDFLDCPSSLIDQKNSTLEFLMKIEADELVRDDYKELLQLCILFIQGKTDKIVTFKTCGALHKARWMAKIIYGIKMVLMVTKVNKLHKQKAVFAKGQFDKLVQFIMFSVYVYAPYWFKAHSAIHAPQNDLLFYHSLKNYAKYNPVVSEAAIKAFSNHLWYMNEETVCLSLFDENIADVTRKSIAKKLLPHMNSLKPKLSNRYGEGFGKPMMPVLNDKTTLTSIIGPNSPFLFQCLDLKPKFLKKPVPLWKEDESYQLIRDTLRGLKVVNDLAE